MIVICEQCQTRFKLDETRIPPGGARVRCSRCKHAFFLPAPGSDEPDLLDELIGQTAAEPRPAPPPSEDPGGSDPAPKPAAPEPPPAPEPARPAGAASPQGDDAREADWEFSEDLPEVQEGAEAVRFEPDDLELDEDGPDAPAQGSGLELASEPARPTPQIASPPPAPPLASAPPQRPATAPGADDDLKWDFDQEDLTPAPRDAEPVPGGRARAVLPVAEDPALSEPILAPPAAELLEAPERVGRLLAAAGWLATVVLVGTVSAQLLSAPAPGDREAISTRPVGSLVAESLEGRFIDNLFAGPLLVVSAELHNPGEQPTSLGAVLRAVLVDSEGTPVPGSQAALAPALERELREHPPEALATRLAARGRSLAAEVLAPGSSVAVVAVFPAVPPDATGLALEMGPRIPREPSAPDVPGPEPAPEAPRS